MACIVDKIAKGKRMSLGCIDMRVCIQDIDSNEYFCRPFVWVENRSQAYNFGTAWDAREFCLQIQNGRRVRVILLFENASEEVCLFIFS